ncbi:hypothetical protein JAB5_04220 [Janthinobacterium sp. HH103]|uniref:hypothetical protein n=1 Tax=unclassified Janthinobacterium TaxID=2610881 RepID=UPI000874E346|nr:MULTISPECIES: hypothetical protein [unclassified Janthinobacterium]OEZ66129.1 hypothetical protein JAB2_30790 [Janthinobacterium sp. HH100]OEZ87092.1 hypothetical protein JAB5_04220 [Janthinobacterium sp. HH103]PHV40397.1 hypothetical protein CSQ95_04845 [Janthinobacterium sp. BJB304]QOU73026.1 hypothetical protein JAB4_024790 [Janthinobacterium sp. HH102]
MQVHIGEGAEKTPQQEEEARREFIAELWRRFEALQEWAVSHWPDQQHPLSSADFVETRKEILSLRSPAGSLNQPSLNNEAEPEQGGAQYQDVTPAPWP